MLLTSLFLFILSDLNFYLYDKRSIHSDFLYNPVEHKCCDNVDSLHDEHPIYGGLF